MPNERVDLRRIDWIETFPFVRLFRTFGFAVRLERMAVAFAMIFLVYVAGHVLDTFWLAAGGGVPVIPEVNGTAVEAFTELGSDEFEKTLQQANANYNQLSENVTEDAATAGETDWPATLQENYKTQRAAAETAEQRSDLAAAHDLIAFSLAGQQPLANADLFELTSAAKLLGFPDDQLAGLHAATQLALLKSMQAELEPIGPYAALQQFVLECASGAVQGALAFRFGLEGGIDSPQPSLAACVIQGGEGLMYFFFYRPWFALIFGIVIVVVGAYFGGAIQRHAAVQMTRDELIGMGDAFAFSGQKLPQMLFAPLGVIGGILVLAFLLVLGGLIGAIPVIGPVISGLLFGLALVGGLVITLALNAMIFSIHLMWPLIMIEGSDAYDAVSRGASYAGQRLWNLVFYNLALLVYGSFALLIVRIIAMFVLKVTHATVGIGMSFFGATTSAKTETLDRLSAMWYMPAWNELTLIPTVNGTPFWGDFFHAPLSGPESVAAFLIAIWVFVVVTLVGAFAASFYFVGCNQIYLLIRRDHDAVDYDDIYYEGEEIFAGEPGTSLPIVASGPTTTPAPSEEPTPEAPGEDEPPAESSKE